MGRVLLVLIGIVLLGCSPTPYPEVKKGSFIKIHFKDDAPPRYGQVESKTSESITLNQGVAFEVYPWTTIHHVELATPAPNK